MTIPTKEYVLALLRTGTPDERVALLKSLPPNGFTDSVVDLIKSDSPGMIIVALGPMIMEYCYGGNPEVGAVLAAAAHERAVEIWQTEPKHGLIPTTLSGLANSYVKALTLLGRSKEVLEATDRYIQFYEKLGEHENLPSLKVLRIEALVNLKQLDDADAALREEALLQHPIVGIEAKRLKGWVDRYRSDPTLLKSEQTPAPPPPSSQDLLDILKTAIGLSFEGEAGEKLKQKVDRLDPRNRLDPEDPEQYKKLGEILNQGEQFLTKSDEGSELAVRGIIRNASSIFMHGTPEAGVIQCSLADLESSLTWARKHGVTELENDALWGMYLCNSRLHRHSQAADALIHLRGNLESLRRGIKDPLKRGGIFSTYKYLFNVLCENLYKAGRAEELLMAIESSKGRVIADRLTAQTGEVVEDAAIYGCVARLPELVRRERFNYLTYFVDEASVYAALVSKEGMVYAIDPVHIRNHELRDAAAHVAPKQWDERKSSDSGTQVMNVSMRLAPLVAWLDGLLEQGIVEKDDHICYSSDDDFNNVPLHYLRFRDGILIDWFSVSRVHSAFHLDHVLSSKASGCFDRFAGFVVPLRQDLERQNRDAFLANLDAPLNWLKDYGLSGNPVRLSEATLERVTKESLDHRVVHFSTHGWFPEQQGNPFHDSFLLLAGEDGLPDEERVNRGTHKGKLTPSGILDANLNLEGSHISMMACVSGLAKEGIAGDTLGLDWAFIQAGASSLISTHWKISATCAARFFTLFYEKWIEDKQSRASAFRATMLELLHGDHTPNSLQRWTAFSLTGDFR
jgi:CHAT domain-containing protein